MGDVPWVDESWSASDCEGCVLNVKGRRRCCQDDLAAGYYRAFNRFLFGSRRDRKPIPVPVCLVPGLDSAEADGGEGALPPLNADDGPEG